MKLYTLGQCAAEIGEERLGPESEVLFALALYLGVERGKPTGRAALGSLLWPASGSKAGHNLRQTVYRLRSFGVSVNSDRSHVWIDTDACEADFAPLQGAQASSDVESLAATIGGSFLPGYAPNVSEAFSEWVERQRDLFDSAVRRVLVAALASKRSRGDWPGVEDLASRLLALDPLNEEATLAKAEAAALHGGKAQAIAILDRYKAEIGPAGREIQLPASLLRRRIAEAPVFDESQRVTEPPFVGRADEMAALNLALQKARAGEGSAHLLWGEPGIGKSRLAREFTRAASLGRISVARVACSATDERRPLSAFVDVVPKLLNLPGGLGCSPESMPYLKRLTDRASHEGLPSPESREAAYLYSSIRRAILDLVDAVASEGCLLLEIEDVHWLDTMSWDVLGELLAWIASRRVIVLLTSREAEPDARRGPAFLSGLRRHHVGPLADRAGRQLLDALQRGGSEPTSDDFRDWCVSAGHGNPYFLSELAVHDQSSAAREALPASLTALLSERLVRLQPAARRVLQAIALMGRHSTVARLEAVLGESRLSLVDALDELELNGLIATEGSALLAKHDLLAQAALSRLSIASRRLLHRHVAEALERESEVGQSVAGVWDCAEHWQRAGDEARAIRFLRDCARHALEVGVPTEAAELFFRAGQLATDGSTRREMQKGQARAWQLAGDWAAVQRVLKSVTKDRALAPTPYEVHDDEELLAFEACWQTGEGCDTLLSRVSACAHNSHASLLHRIKAATLTVRFADNLCEPEFARLAYERVARDPHYGNMDTSALLPLELIYHTSFGDHNLAIRAARELIECNRKLSSPASLARSLQQSAIALRSAGLIEEALSLLTESYDVAARHSLSGLACVSASLLAWTHVSLGESSVAETWYERGVASLTDKTSGVAMSGIQGAGVAIAIARGDFDRAEDLLRRSRAYWRAHSHPRGQVLHLGFGHLIRLKRDGRLPSADELRELCSVFERTRSLVSQDYAAFLVADLLDAAGERDQARGILQAFLGSYRRDRGRPALELQRVATRLGINP